MGRSIVGQLMDLLRVVWTANVCLLALLGGGLGYLRALRKASGCSPPPRFEELDANECEYFVTIVITVLDDAKVIGRTIRNLESTTANKGMVEVVLVDAGCSDNTMAVAKASAGAIKVHYIRATPGGATPEDDYCQGRGRFLNAGFEHSTQRRRARESSRQSADGPAPREVVLFMHADALTAPNYDAR
jgi:cellulose synthase/poly-beta-1,6-N-acetylglucosamine synthase-like glycosyltransferase